jgi:hypothetical protein
MELAVSRSPFFIGDSMLRLIPHNRGLNYRDCTFTHDVWIMMMNFPLEAWMVEKICESVSSFGRFLVWHRDNSNKARIIVKIRVTNLLDIPISHVLVENTNDAGHGQSWTSVIYILDARLIGGLGPDEDPIDDEANPHPLPNIPFGGIWDDEDPEENPADHQDHMDFNGNDAHHVPHAAPAADTEPMVHTPTLPVHGQTSSAQAFAASLATNTLNPMIEAVDSYTALNKLMVDMLQHAPTVINNINTSCVSGIRVSTLDVIDVASAARKCLLTVYVSEPAPAPISTVQITEIFDEPPLHDLQVDSQAYLSPVHDYYDDHDASDEVMDNLDLNQSPVSVVQGDHISAKRKAAEPKDVTEVRRSTRIATKKAGYKTKEAKEKAELGNSVKITEAKQNDAKSKKAKGKKQAAAAPLLLFDTSGYYHR